MKLSTEQIISLLGCLPVVQAKNPDQMIESLTWDSRMVQAGGAFLALAGEHVDGNDFLEAALQQGAALLIASRPTSPSLRQQATEAGAAVIEVLDAEFSLGEIARYWRDFLTAQVIGVTGSSGKTSTKELIALVLGQRFKTQMSPGNFNNLLGLPAALLDCRSDTELLVLEMGMQHKGEISRYAQIARPQYAVFTNIGLAHLELLGSQRAIAEAKAELLIALPDQQGLAVLNGDDPMSDYLLQFSAAQKRGIQIIKYGLSNQHQVYASDLEFDQSGQPSFKVNLPENENFRVSLKLSGQHSVLNALAATAIAHLLGVSTGDIQTGLEAAEPMSQRQEIIEHPSGTRLINDCYNANPDSMRASLQAFNLMSPERVHIAVLGDMLELGPRQTELHKSIGNLVAELKLDMLVTVGERADWIAQAAAECGLEMNRIHSFLDWQEAVKLLLPELRFEPIILVKASRSMALERIVEALSTSS